MKSKDLKMGFNEGTLTLIQFNAFDLIRLAPGSYFQLNGIGLSKKRNLSHRISVEKSPESIRRKLRMTLLFQPSDGQKLPPWTDGILLKMITHTSTPIPPPAPPQTARTSAGARSTDSAICICRFCAWWQGGGIYNHIIMPETCERLQRLHP